MHASQRGVILKIHGNILRIKWKPCVGGGLIAVATTKPLLKKSHMFSTVKFCKWRGCMHLHTPMASVPMSLHNPLQNAFFTQGDISLALWSNADSTSALLLSSAIMSNHISCKLGVSSSPRLWCAFRDASRKALKKGSSPVLLIFVSILFLKCFNEIFICKASCAKHLNGYEKFLTHESWRQTQRCQNIFLTHAPTSYFYSLARDSSLAWTKKVFSLAYAYFQTINHIKHIS